MQSITIHWDQVFTLDVISRWGLILFSAYLIGRALWLLRRTDDTVYRIILIAGIPPNIARPWFIIETLFNTPVAATLPRLVWISRFAAFLMLLMIYATQEAISWSIRAHRTHTNGTGSNSVGN